MTLEYIAQEIGVSVQQLQKYEKGTNRVSAGRVYRLAQILGVEPAYFFDVGPIEEDDASAELPVIVRGNKDAQRLNRSFVKIKEERLRRSIIALIENIAYGHEK